VAVHAHVEFKQAATFDDEKRCRRKRKKRPGDGFSATRLMYFYIWGSNPVIVCPIFALKSRAFFVRH